MVDPGRSRQVLTSRTVSACPVQRLVMQQVAKSALCHGEKQHPKQGNGNHPPKSPPQTQHHGCPIRRIEITPPPQWHERVTGRVHRSISELLQRRIEAVKPKRSDCRQADTHPAEEIQDAHLSE